MQAGSELRILIKSEEIVNVISTNFLGVITESNLSAEVHIESTFSKISRNFFIIKRLCKMLDVIVRRMLYYGLIFPLLLYEITIWG
jgi:hypothetical protein